MQGEGISRRRFGATVGLAAGGTLARAKGAPPENFRRERLVAWCIVPFDARQRGPAERAAMLRRLGMRRCAYDWRRKHVDEFEEEIRQYDRHGIEFFAFWNEHPEAYRLFAAHGLRPQIWKTVPSPAGATEEERVEEAARRLEATARRTAEAGLPFGLYNHGGWGGRPGSLAAVCERLHAQGHEHAGIVYNFHHAHFDLEAFSAGFERMKPRLLCLNLNGMRDPAKHDVTQVRDKICPIGTGELEAELIRTVLQSGYSGPVGILGHRADRDVEVVLRENLEGLDRVLAEIPG